MVAIAEALEQDCTLQHLDVRNNGLCDDDVGPLAEALMLNKTLRVLDLRWNQVSPSNG